MRKNDRYFSPNGQNTPIYTPTIPGQSKLKTAKGPQKGLPKHFPTHQKKVVFGDFLGLFGATFYFS